MSSEMGVLYAEGDNATARARFEELRRIPAGWDGDGADAPDPANIANAERWLAALHTWVSAEERGWIPPHISCTPWGEVTMEWWKGERQLTVFFQSDEDIYIKAWGTNITTEMEHGALTAEADSRALWAWLAGIPSP